MASTSTSAAEDGVHIEDMSSESFYGKFIFPGGLTESEYRVMN